MIIHEVKTSEDVIKTLIALSADWEKEQSCYGYRANTREDLAGRRVFLAEENGETLGYLFGIVFPAQNMRSVIPDGAPCFEAEELYVVPPRRREGIGAALFRYAEKTLAGDAEYIVLSTASKNREAVFRFYLDELDMNFWSARLYKKI
ncbi:MAG: GNAT family N-acetyltransferase [Clostridia bacterium]|nr:GNAT family N-acetyltransferase [Clostridia bacterium]